MKNAKFGVLFDLDGTLTDTLEDLADGANATMREMGYPERSLEEVRRFVGHGAPYLIGCCLPEGVSEDVRAAAVACFPRHYPGGHGIKTKPYDGIAALLDRLLEQHIVCGVVTNKPQAAAEDVCRHFFGERLYPVIGDDGHRAVKPAKDGVEQALGQMGIEICDCIYVGDSEVDVETAHNAGMFGIAVTWGFREKKELTAAGAAVLADNTAELERLIFQRFSVIQQEKAN